MGAFFRGALAAAALTMLAGCLLTPGKFTSKLVVNADRSFTYSYVGEVYAVDPQNSVPDAPPASSEDDDGETKQAVFILTQAAPKPGKKAEAEARNRAIAEALSKEAGYRSVRYMGEGKFLIDYQTAGTLTHHFLYPFNVDAQAIVPFVAAELRANGTVRVKAPGFANEAKNQMGPMSGMADSGAKLDGVFVLETDAEIVSQNNEDGPVTNGGRKTITWKASPLTRDAPTAVLRLR
jgi:hypothetical protein